MALAKDSDPEIHRPDRFGIGTYMTIAVVDEESIFGEGVVDFKELTCKLQQYGMLIDECCSSKVRKKCETKQSVNLLSTLITNTQIHK